VSKEEFNVTFNNMATQTAVEGVQVVSMTYTGSAEGSWQIGMLGVYSGETVIWSIGSSE